MEFEYLSASRIEVFETCPLMYWASYVKKVEKPEPHPLTIVGKIVHEALEGYANDTNFSIEDCLEKRVEAEYLPLAKTLVANAVKRTTKPIAVEKEFLLNIDGVKIKGFMDRVESNNGKIEILDWKTGKKDFSNPSKLWQSRIYALAASEMYGGDMSLEYWVLRTGEKYGFDISETYLKESRIALLSMADKIKGCENPVGRPSGLCSYCLWENNCTDKEKSAKSRFKWKKPTTSA